MNEKKLEVVRPSTVDASVFDGDLKLENAKLRERMKDLDGQIERLQAGRTILPHEEEANAAMARDFEAMRKEQNAIALFLREHYHEEISLGLHNGRSLSDIICAYLGQLKTLRAKRRPT